MIDYDRSLTPGFNGEILQNPKIAKPAYTSEFREWLYTAQSGLCAYCGEWMGDTWRYNARSNIEHIVSRKHGGSDYPPNLVYSCSTCNNQKNSKHQLRLKVTIPLRRLGINNLLKPINALTLIESGLLNVRLLDEFLYEKMKWPHAPIYDQKYEKEGEEADIVRRILINQKSERLRLESWSDDQ